MSGNINPPHPDEYPPTVPDALDFLVQVIPRDTLDALAGLSEDDLIELHFTLGTAIRNQLGLWDNGSRLMADLRQRAGDIHPDDASAEIIRLLWARMRQQ